jgi:penicillin amidase
VAHARDRIAGTAVGLGLLVRALATPPPRSVPLAGRLAALPGRLPVAEAVRIHWSDQQIPFIEARSDADLAVALGAVHAHLRLAQMEMMRRVALGRVAETIGPLGIELDRALHLFDFGRAVPRIIAGLDDDTRAWAMGFLSGVNHVLAHGAPPHEFRLLGIAPEPWSLTDLFTTARLAAADVSWLVWGRLLKARAGLAAAEWAALWPRLLAGGQPAPAADGDAEAAISAFARNGSNACAVAGGRTAGGGALLAADPHLSVTLPNIWLAAGFRSPTLHAVGLMPAGFPIVAIGRNPWIAWGGTALHAASSDLIDASTLALSERRVSIRVRGVGTRHLTLRESPLGPVVSDGLLLRHPTPLALRWIGHTPSDEMGAMLRVMRARDGTEFRAALAGFAAPGQNMLHAGADGHIGHLLAARLPRRAPDAPVDLVAPPAAAEAWQDLVGTPDLPHWTDPPEGFVASANDRPPAGTVPVGYFFSPPDRVDRMRALLGGTCRLGLPELARLQRDVLDPGRLTLRDALLVRLGADEAAWPVVRVLAAWDGGYAADSAGALAYEVLVAEIAARLGAPERLRPLAALWTARALLTQEILATPRLNPVLTQALRRAGGALRRWRTWGAVHRMRLRHHFSALPMVGGRYRFADWPAAGGNDTLNKTGHGLVRGRHAVSYGASARFLADLSDLDASHVVLLGGQDGWLGSDTFLDQAAAWRRGDYFALPLRPETARAWPHHTDLMPLRC